ncbi:MAG: TetR family transcriptional regulator [Myxococcota bacterium]
METEGSLLAGVWKRARSDEQKQHRRAALLHAATRMLEQSPVDEISLSTIAREANISKASVYRYFESREELFLHLMLEAMERWSNAVIARLQRLSSPGDARGFASAITAATMEHETFPRLASVLATVLERNVSTDVVVEFKLGFMQPMGGLLQAIGQALPELSATQVRKLVEVTYFQMVGMWPAAHPAPAVHEALQRPDLAHACVDFESSLEQTLRVTIAGLRALAEE